MSGGHFYYAQFRLNDIASTIKEEIGRHNFCDSTYAEFERAIVALRKAEVYATRIDWLISGDDSEETFHERLAQDLKEIP